MKKLLAIVLCIAMIASLSVTAFADQAAASTVSGVSLYPAVKQANHFYGSLMKYDIMNTVAGLFKGFSTLFKEAADRCLALAEDTVLQAACLRESDMCHL